MIAVAASTSSGRSTGLPATGVTAKLVVKTLPAMFSMRSTSPSLVARNSGAPRRLIRSASLRATVARLSPVTGRTVALKPARALILKASAATNSSSVVTSTEFTISP
ncbi:hypothetical protein D3C83_45510 [compost metagenome]